MKAARFRLGASENPKGNQGRQLCWRPGIIECAGETDLGHRLTSILPLVPEIGILTDDSGWLDGFLKS